MLVPADQEAGSTVEHGISVHRFAYLPCSWRKLAYGSGMLPNLVHQPWLWLQVPFLVLIMLVHLIRLVRRIRPDVIHAHWVIPQGLLAAICRPLTPAPIIISAHGADAFGLRGGVFARLKRYALRRSNAWTANTGTTSSALRHVGYNDVPDPYIIPMGVDVDHFSRGRRNRLRTGPDDQCVLLFVGRLVEKKGVADLIQAFALLSKEIQEKCVLWVAGEGHMRPSLENKAEKLGIARKIRFWGNIDQDALPDLYAAADIFVGPSIVDKAGDTEGQGVVFLEASCAGLAIVATRAGGIIDVVHHEENGLLVSPGAPEELAAAITSLVQNEPLRARLGSRARAQVREKYSWQVIAEKFENLYLDHCTPHTDSGPR
jgi:glycosyltransferase involved in cell wall biosynthesis